MLIQVSVTLMCVVLPVLKGASVVKGPMCMNCHDEAVPSSCNTISHCGSHQQCFLQEIVNDNGMLQYRSGCMDATSCSVSHSNGRRDEVVICQQCCVGDFCNAKGCSYTEGFPHGVGFGPVCFNCHSVSDLSLCSKITRCPEGNYCFSKKLADNSYNMGCSPSQNCGAISQPNRCGSCCAGNFCNSKCNSTSAFMTTSGMVTTILPPWITTAATQAPTSTSHYQIINCYDCGYQIQPTACHHIRTCGQNEVCLSQTFDHGVPLYQFKCADKSECPITDKWTPVQGLIGKRSTAVTIKCCSSDACNSQAPPPQSLATAPPTTTSSTTLPTTPLPTRPVVTSLNKHSYVGSTRIVLECTATGSPPPTYSWDIPLHNHVATNYHLSGSSKYLTINHATSNNEGYYTCIASNTQGTAQKTYYLTV